MRSRMLSVLAGIAIATAASGAALAAPQVSVRVDPNLGPIYTDASGRTLYTWDRDTEPNVSTCTGGCLANWPLFPATASDVAEGPWTIVTRADGGMVWAFNGDPLYYYVNDTAPGQTNGNQPSGTWHVLPLVKWTASAGLGTIMTDAAGWTLYTWDRDTEANVSTCTGGCLVNWPLFTATSADIGGGDWVVVTRADGGMVWSYKGDPLYYFINDTAPGQTNGNQPTGTWHVIPAPAM